MDVMAGDILVLPGGELFTVTSTCLSAISVYELTVRIVGRGRSGEVSVVEIDRGATVPIETEPLDNEQFDATYDTAHSGICQLIQEVRKVMRHKHPALVEASREGPDSYLLRLDCLLADLVSVERDLRMAYVDLATAGEGP